MQLFKGEGDWLQRLAVYVREDFSAYRQHSSERGCCEVIVVRICSSPTNQKNCPSVGTIASTLAQHSAIYVNTLGQYSWFVGSSHNFFCILRVPDSIFIG